MHTLPNLSRASGFLDDQGELQGSCDVRILDFCLQRLNVWDSFRGHAGRPSDSHCNRYCIVIASLISAWRAHATRTGHRISLPKKTENAIERLVAD
jgi:hypothetical protein